MSNTRREPRTVLGELEPTFMVHTKQKEAAHPQILVSITEKPFKPNGGLIWLLGQLWSLWFVWMAFSWTMVLVFTIGRYFEAPFWYWLAFALLAVGFRFVLESWGAKVQGIKEDDYDLSKYPWWSRKIRLPRRGSR